MLNQCHWFRITDVEGNPTQFVCYMPFGEAFVDEHTIRTEMLFKFNGKEQDSETGLYYYGARYYEPRECRFYGVDPMAEKYPNMGAFVYCNNNPVKFIDPTGMEGEDPEGNKSLVNEQTSKYGWGNISGENKLPKLSKEKDIESLYKGGGGENNSNKGEGSKDNNRFQAVDIKYFNVTEYFSGLIEWLLFEPNSNNNIPEEIRNELPYKGKIAREITPYVSISIGRETNEFKLNPTSGFGSLILTPNALYAAAGGDVTYGFSADGTKTSISISFDFYNGSKSGIEGWGVGYSGGSYVGYNRGYSLDVNKSKLQLSLGKTNSYGINISNCRLYGSGNVSHTWKLLNW